MRQTAGLIATMIGNCAPFRGENAKTFSPMDFFPDHKEQEEQQTARDHEFILSKIFKRPPTK